MQLGRNGGFSLGAQRRSGGQSLRVIGQGEILDVAQQRLERVGLTGQLVVVPRSGRVGRQGQHVRQVRARVELRSVRVDVIAQCLRQQNYAVQIEFLFILENVRQHRGAQSSVALSEQILGRIPPLVPR